MKGVMPQEIEVWYILPALRKEFTKLMVKKGLTQREVAQKLLITEAAVSQYLKGKRGGNLEFSEELQNEIEQGVERLLNSGLIVREFQMLCRKVRESKMLCDIHKKYGITPPECEEGVVCLEENANSKIWNK